MREGRRGATSLRETVLLGGLAVYSLAYVTWLLTTDLPAEARARASDLAFLPVGLIVVVLAWRASRGPALDAPTRRAWRFLTLSFLFFWLGDVLWYLSSWIWVTPELANVAQLAYVAYYPPLMVGLLSFPRSVRNRAEAAQYWLDVATVFLGGLMLLWSVLVAPITTLGAADMATAFLAIGYPLGDLILLFGMSVVAARRRAETGRMVFLFLLSAIAATLLNDVFFSVQSLVGGYQSGSSVDLIQMMAWLLFGASAAAQLRPVAAAAEPRTASRPDVSMSMAPYLAVVVGYGALFLAALDRNTQSMAGIVVGAVVLTALVLLRQITAVRENMRLSTEQAARESEARFRSLVQNSSDIIAVVGTDSTLRYHTPSVQRLLGYRPEELEGVRLLSLVHPEDQPRALSVIVETVARPGEPAPVEWRLKRRGGEWFFAEVLVTNLLSDATIAGLVVTIRDIGERKALERQLTHQAFHDPLTGLANRALLADRVAHAQARSQRDKRPCAVVLLDLDDFKAVNDTLGHAAGDEALIEIGKRLVGCIRAGDTAARLGGDEFALLLEDTPDAATAREVAERIAEALKPPVLLGGKEAFLSASIGIALSQLGEAEGELVRNADVALYISKGEGKGRCAVFEPGMRAAVLDRMELEADLRRAVERSELVLHYQPIADLATGRIVGAEALLRWQHPRRGLMAPGAFIPLAEETGLIVPIGRWVLEEACRKIGRLPRGPSPIHISVNLSARQLQEADLVDQVRAALDAARLHPSQLVLEVTESMLMQEPATMVARLRALKELGVRLAIDDFGTGYSSLSYLQNLPVDVLKMDRSFIRDPAPGGLSLLARGIVDLGRAMHLVMVAEGIEHADQARALKGAGCELGQGYFLARPMEQSAFESLLTATPVLCLDPRDV